MLKRSKDIESERNKETKAKEIKKLTLCLLAAE
jgi:hypothetical protein